MRKALVFVAAALALGGFWWMLRPTPKGRPASKSTEEQARASNVELAQLLTPDPEGSGAEAVPNLAPEPRVGRSRLAPERSAERPREAPVRGRLIVAETGDPIAAALSVRLRTLDLGRKEQLLTNSDGTFTSASSYPAGVLLALVKTREGRELVDHEAAFDPVAADEWSVPIPSRMYPTFARGTVVDRRGNPLGEVPVRLVPLGPVLPCVETLSGEYGRFELNDLRGGTYRLELQGLWQRSEPVDVVLRAGANELGPLVLDELRGAGLLVRFVCPESADFPAALAVVRPASLSRAVPFYSYSADERGGGIFELRLDRVPAGECTITMESLDGRTYEPERRVVQVPAELEVRVGGEPRPGRLLRVRDAQTGEALMAFEAWRRWHGTWSSSGISNPHGKSTGALDLWSADAWVVLASGHRGVRGSAAPDAEGFVEVVLERGWSELLVFEDAEGDTSGNPDFGRARPLLASVEVFADGTLAGVSDADGIVLLEGDEPPANLEFRLQGWRVVRERKGRLHQVWMARTR